MEQSKNFQAANKLLMFHVAVGNMPKAKEFYSDKLGLKVIQDYRQDDDHWWVSLTPPEGGVNITLSTFHGHLKPGTMQMYFSTSDIAAAHKELSKQDLKVSDINNDLYGPGSGVKWLTLKDPDGNHVYLAQS